MWEKALEIASRTTHPYAVVAFALVCGIGPLFIASRAKKPFTVWPLSIVIILLGLAPTIASAILRHQGIYHIRISILNMDKQPVNDADVSSSVGGELKKASFNWEFDLAPQTKPSDGKVTFFASVKGASLVGSTTLVLGEHYFLTTTIQLTPIPATTLRGIVEDESGRSVAGAKISVAGYPDIAIADSMGNFALPAHAADGQMVSVRAQKGNLVAEDLVPAGKVAVIVVRKR